jgi:cytochrome d ubiquinol oxidase subunit I
MDNLFAARCQMGMSLAFHIVFAAIGIALPLMTVVAETIWLRTGDKGYLELAKRWARGTAILFAVGAVSGTILSFELGLLWPNFMHWAGGIIGLLFALEGFAFFGEAIFLGIYLYGWQRIRPSFHVISGLLVALNGAASAVFVVTANAWMNTPSGFHLLNGLPVDIDPVQAMLNPAAAYEVIHMLIAAYAATTILMAGIHAVFLLDQPGNLFHRRAFLLSICLAAVMSLIQPVSGDFISRMVARNQPIKLAALEGQFKTEPYAPLRIGGIVDPQHRRTDFAISIPGGLSFLAYHNPAATVRGLNSVFESEWPPVPAVHIMFQIMVACGTWLGVVALWTVVLLLRRVDLAAQRGYLKAVIIAAPLGFVAIESGWMVTELGRQPWVIAGIMKTSQAVTPVPGMAIQFVIYTIVYVLLAAAVVWLMSREFEQSPDADAEVV